MLEHEDKLMAEAHGNRLDQLLREQAEQLNAEALQNDGKISAQQIKRVERLARLAKVREAMRPSVPPKRWPVIAVFWATVAFFGLLLLPLSEMEIELDLVVSEVDFTSPAQQILKRGVSLRMLEVSGLQELRMPHPFEQADTTLFTSDNSAFKANLWADTTNGTLDLSEIELPARAHVSLRSLEGHRQYLLALSGINRDLTAEVDGNVEVSIVHAPPLFLKLPSPRSISMRLASNETALHMTVLEVEPITLGSQFFASALAFYEVDKGPPPRKISPILSGALYFEELNEKEHRFRAGEWLRFKRSEGEIRTLQLSENKIAINFHGRVQGMSTGTENNRRSLMPTYLEWLSARHILILFWSGVFYVFFIILWPALRWWRKPE